MQVSLPLRSFRRDTWECAHSLPQLPLPLSHCRPLQVRVDKLFAAHLPTNYDRWLEVDEPYQITWVWSRSGCGPEADGVTCTRVWS